MAKRKKGILLGAVADDMTGATDLCNTLVASGMRTVQMIDVPEKGMVVPDADAVVVALKSRNTQAIRAVRKSLKAMDWLKSAGAKQYFFKYCSTFDSTPSGNIGPVADAMLERIKGGITIACPAFPTNGRTVFRGHLFVGDVLLSASGMRNHPITPMTNANLVEVLGEQTPYAVGLVPWETVDQGPDAIAKALQGLRKEGKRHAIVDALSDKNLIDIGRASAKLKLITGGSGVAMGLSANFRASGALGRRGNAASLPRAKGHAAVIAGSCSEATLDQIARMKKAKHPTFHVDAVKLGGKQDIVQEAIAWAKPKLGQKPILIYASASPAEIAKAQAKHGRDKAGALVERALAKITKGLVKAGVGKLVLAGGETSGAAVQALGVRGLMIGKQIDPGVPWCMSLGDAPLHLALKSGNFGAPDFFTKAFKVLD
ncbi:MAG: four-carbon acid sugar kinase family protein [Rhodospirillaceae bacterium]|jgi:uncharacterized protein YgbK (DUF1537 family)|nr:four-carbon acid sugar kinase family protein [Rhodospirillaceae bacterium]MBT3629034.1 four-carbon acid sugar kinase family protein [Rhodospirillaceae bacterium]MBT3925778.1 four-carbon acid sugar kinase family protein [Rhodospirillaceae bacterium]MBT4427779.1 four-carbon acid sugar kinase family protein [Rhodospirillaceae bacterium]MBT5039805.1 four-carbon acid sugar kinase family protein [Rhodospirillaceae bacterium]